MRGKERRWKIVALLAVGIAIGVAMTATPAVGHVSGWVHNWNRHIKPRADARYFIKAQAEARYYNVGETVANATNATNATNAANADKLDGLDSADVQRKVRWALISAAGAILDQSGGVSVTPPSGGGSYWINLGADVSRSAIVASHRGFDGFAQVNQCAGPTGVGCVAAADNVNHVFVYTRNAVGTVAARDFYVAAVG